MDETNAIGYVVLGLGALIGIITPILKLNTTITKLNSNFEHMNENDKKRDESIDEMENDIALINKVQFEHKTCLKNHEDRITKLEERN